MAVRVVAGALICVALAGGCGYRLAGGGPVAGPVTTLWIGAVEDQGDEPLFGARLARALAREAVNRADTALVQQQRAQAQLTAQVDSVVERAGAYSAVEVVREYVVAAEVTATLTRPGGAAIWRGRNIHADREFLAGRDVNETENNKGRALELLARDLAREVLRRVALALGETGS